MGDNQYTILIADDNYDNLALLGALLESLGYKIRIAIDGPSTLDSIELSPPDLLLLDINMPGMNGYEVCEKLKKDLRFQQIPVIFISAMGEEIDKVRAFNLGGVDYITKPIQLEETRARIETHLKIASLERSLREKNRALNKSLAQQQTLEEERNELIHMMVHDMRTPLMTIRGYLELMERSLLKPDQKISARHIHRALGGVDHLVDMITGILEIRRLESGVVEPVLELVVLNQLIDDIVIPLKESSGYHTIVINQREEVICFGDRELIQRVIENLITNGIKHTPKGSEIIISGERSGEMIMVVISDNGAGIPEDQRALIFQKFARIPTNGKINIAGYGMGLAFCKLAVELMGGEIGVKETPGGGTTFWFTLPIKSSS